MSEAQSAPESTQLDEYLRPCCDAWSLDTYHSRISILRSVQRAVPHMSGVLLDVGCGWCPYRSVVLGGGSAVTQYVGMDLEGGRYARKPELKWDGTAIPLPDASVGCAMATEVLEHTPEPETVLSEICRVLTPGGFFLLTVPFLWPLHDVPYDEYRYTPFSLERHLRRAGFSEVRIEALGGWDASLATMVGLWVRRRGMGLTSQRILQRLLLPLYRWLLRSDTPPRDFTHSCMITGLSATARKPVGP